MKSVLYSIHGAADVLRVEERPLPMVGSGDIRVRIMVSGVNPTDWKARLGTGGYRDVGHDQVPHQDGAGYVDAIGEGVRGFEVGDRVWVWNAAWQRPEGTAQEYVVLPARQVVALPDSASFDDGASLGIPALTAHRALTSFELALPELSPGSLRGRTVLVAGGAGVVGHAAIQLAVWAGATVLSSVSSTEKGELARRAGAHHVINYRSENVAEAVAAVAPMGADIIVEVSSSANMETNMKAVATNGSIAIFASSTFGKDEAEILKVPVRPSMSKNVRFQFILTYTTDVAEKSAAVAGVSRALKDGALAVGAETGLSVHRFSLMNVAEAHRASEQGILGKVLVDVHPPEPSR